MSHIRSEARLFISFSVRAQKEIKTYYDDSKSRLNEDYFVIDDNQTMEGKYRRYFPNGKLAMEGTFVNGVRSGTFYEYHENGTLIRKINYENGMRHGQVEVFDEKGKPIQTAFYQNNQLVDSVKSYFPFKPVASVMGRPISVDRYSAKLAMVSSA